MPMLLSRVHHESVVVACADCGHWVETSPTIRTRRRLVPARRQARCFITLPDDYHPWTGESCGCTNELHSRGLPYPEWARTGGQPI